MAAITLSWVGRNGPVQADIPVDHFAAGVTPADGWQVVVEWRFRADPGDAWGAPTIHIVTPPALSASYEPPADGWVQVTSYSIQSGRVSWDTLLQVVRVLAGELVIPMALATEANIVTVTEDGRSIYKE